MKGIVGYAITDPERQAAHLRSREERRSRRAERRKSIPPSRAEAKKDAAAAAGVACLDNLIRRAER